MALRDLLVYLDQTERALLRLRLAADLARRNGSRITALYADGWSPTQLEQRQTAEMAGRSMDELAHLQRSVQAAITVDAQRLQTELERLGKQYGVATEWRITPDEPRTALPQHARYADLCVLAVDTPSGSTSAGYRFSEEMIFNAGRPVLFIPARGDFATLGRHVAIAWNSSGPAARALNAALPVIENAEHVTVLAINPEDYLGRHQAPPLAKLLEHLEHHGVRAKLIEATQVLPENIAPELQRGALAAGADLLVAGAYGHARVVEILMGGVTRDLLRDMALPILMSN